MKEHTAKAPFYHSFQPDTGEYIASGLCDFSPARDTKGELIEPNLPLVPGHSTLTAPPELQPKQAAIWDGEAWSIVGDCRGEVRWHEGAFHVIDGLGEPAMPPITIHDAQYLIDERNSDSNHGFIHVAINDDEIVIEDIPNTVERRVLAAWEAMGETIRPADPPDDLETLDEARERVAVEEAGNALALDKAAAEAVEGTQIPQPEETTS